MKINKVLVIHGPNLNLLGTREPEIYGSMTMQDINEDLAKQAKEHNIEIDFFQSNHEGEIIDKLHEASDIFDGVVINPGAFSHYSYAIYDAIKSININCVEVHISNIHQRQEEFRKKSVTAGACIGQISGFGFYGYILAINALVNSI